MHEALLRQAGTYRLYWEYEHCRSPEVFLTRQKADPDVQSRTRPATWDADASTPGRALRTVYGALDGRGLYLEAVTEPDSSAAFGAMRRCCDVAVAFRLAAERRFGKGADDGWSLVASDKAVREAETAAAECGPYFEEATLALDPPVRLVRTRAGTWKVRSSNFLERDRPAPWLKRHADALTRTADGIRAGKYATFADAEKALRQTLIDTITADEAPPEPPK
jgi:hypothetical protein